MSDVFPGHSLPPSFISAEINGKSAQQSFMVIQDELILGVFGYTKIVVLSLMRQVDDPVARPPAG